MVSTTSLHVCRNTVKSLWRKQEAYLSAGNTGKPLNLVLRRVFTTVSTLSTALKPTTGLAITCDAQPVMGDDLRMATDA